MIIACIRASIKMDHTQFFEQMLVALVFVKTFLQFKINSNSQQINSYINARGKTRFDLLITNH